MIYNIRSDDGSLLNAKLEIDDGSIVVHSRGGAFGKANLRNPDYRKAVRLILDRLKESRIDVTGIWLHSSTAIAWPEAERLLLSPNEFSMPTEEIVTMVGQRGAAKGRPIGAEGHGNSTKKIRIGVARCSLPVLVNVLRAAPQLTGRLPADVLRKVTSADIDDAVVRLLAGAPHAFAPSVNYDLLLPDGQRLPPKAVFGLALARTLGRVATPDDFSGGRGTPCFDLLEEAGYPVITKHEVALSASPDADAEREWAEGKPKRVEHLRKERAPGLAQAKRRSFEAQHGHLFCERCGLIPSQTLGPHGDACIEVHHRVAVASMPAGHKTRLDDLMCLCANCHRIIHREMRD